jgi:16S rRNA (adenine1518-N6/adenine1519-N6)-dimethyltransferase
MRALKRFGQHFLEAAWADKLIAAIDPQPGDHFLEIGAGPGALTIRLAPRVARLTAVEVDPAMIGALGPKLPANVTLLHADFLNLDPASLGTGPVRVAGNLPYNVSSPILFKLIGMHRAFGRGVAGPALLDASWRVQREVAERIEAKPGGRDYGVLAILVQLHADVRRALTLPPGAFRPPPKVHSAVVSLHFRSPRVAVHDDDAFTAMVRSMFTQRRKTLSNALKPYAESLGASAAGALAAAGIDPQRRPETLQLEELARLAALFNPR